MQLYFITPAISNKRIQLRLTGEPSLTSPADPFGNTFAGGKVGMGWDEREGAPPACACRAALGPAGHAARAR